MEKPLKIILADDDPDDRELFLELIAQSNVSVSAVSNGKELLEVLNESAANLPDCIFLDLNMPVMAGKECLSQIRSTKTLQSIPVIIYSTSANQKDIDDTFDLGANLYLVKASSYILLKKTLEAILNLDWANFQTRSRQNFLFNLD